ncbi:Magnesium transporter NIPA [Ceratobasidium sp. AG-Ba]|nr:Magnesium transporter NIPA [Ceratobasidium sp. AG-Ba]
MLEDKWIGLGLACTSSLAIGTSFIITKKGLNDAARRAPASQNASDNLAYLQNPIWWAGMITMIIGEIANFAAYTFAPAILVTPLGALSVLIGAVLASVLLHEELGHIGRVGCTLCLLGSVIIVLHAPEDKEVQTVDEILQYAIQPGFLMYVFCVTVYSLFAIYRLVPTFGKKTPLVYISICSLVGSISVMAIKGFGVAVKLTLAGNNQLSHPSTWVFGVVTASCIVIQMNYFNKALDTFSTNVVNPMYYVGFSTATILASALLFRGFNTTDPVNTVSLLAGFITTFLGVHLLNASRHAQTLGQPSRAIEEDDVAWANPPASAGGGHARRSSSLYRFDPEVAAMGNGGGVPLEDVREESDEEGDERTRLHRAGRR